MDKRHDAQWRNNTYAVATGAMAMVLLATHAIYHQFHLQFLLSVLTLFAAQVTHSAGAMANTVEEGSERERKLQEMCGLFNVICFALGLATLLLAMYNTLL